MPDLGTEEGTAILADQFGRKNAFATVGFAQGLPSGELCLHLLPFVRLNDGGMAAFLIILRNFALIDFLLFGEEIHRELLLKSNANIDSIAPLFAYEVQTYQRGCKLSIRIKYSIQNQVTE